ncbi:MAG: hypothetical protein HOV79_25920, partial [Hamadaea sp.]|nr:hypothetical protein [Hamadaea sp.]
MNSFDRQLTEQLHELAGAESESAPPMRQLMERGRRARHRRAVLMTGTSFAVVAIGAAVAVVAGVGGPPAPDARPPAASAGAAQSPKLKLVAAVAASEN